MTISLALALAGWLAYKLAGSMAGSLACWLACRLAGFSLLRRLRNETGQGLLDAGCSTPHLRCRGKAAVSSLAPQFR